MNTLETRIRAATRAAGATVPPDGVPPLRLPAPAAPSRLSRGAPWTRRLAPFAAAVAVVMIAVAVVAVGRSAHRGQAGPELPPAGPPISWYVASGQVPAYYVAITRQANSIAYAVVRSTETGAETGTIRAPAPGGMIVAVSAAADDRTFVLDEQLATEGGFGELPPFQGHAFYLFRLSPSGRPGPPERLPVSVPRGQARTAFALSPDGSRLAVAVQHTDDLQITPGSATELTVYTLATGAKRTWSAVGSLFNGPKSLSWTADQRSLAFVWVPTGTGSGVRLLNLGGAGTGLLADSRPVASLVNQPSHGGRDASVTSTASPTPSPGPLPSLNALSCNRDWIVTPDGSAVVCGANRDVNLKAGYDAEVAFLEYSTVTGKLTRVLGHWTFGDVPYYGTANVLWSDASGRVLIGVIPATAADSGYRVGVISGNQFTPLPAAPGAVSPDLETW